jgi:hypothetical protein
MGLRHVKFAAVEQIYESIHLNQYLDLYDTIATSVSRKKQFTLRREHLEILAILEENIETLLWNIEDKVTILSIKPYQMRFAAAKGALAGHLKELQTMDTFHCPTHLLHLPRVKELLGS